MEAPPPPCRATRADGQPCTARALESGYCFAHDDGLREKRHAARMQGGRNKATTARVQRLMPSTLRPVLDHLYTALEEVHEGTLEPRQAAAMAGLAGAIAKLHEVADLDARLEALTSVLEPERAKALASRRR